MKTIARNTKELSPEMIISILKEFSRINDQVFSMKNIFSEENEYRHLCFELDITIANQMGFTMEINEQIFAETDGETEIYAIMYNLDDEYKTPEEKAVATYSAFTFQKRKFEDEFGIKARPVDRNFILKIIETNIIYQNIFHRLEELGFECKGERYKLYDIIEDLMGFEDNRGTLGEEVYYATKELTEQYKLTEEYEAENVKELSEKYYSIIRRAITKPEAFLKTRNQKQVA